MRVFTLSCLVTLVSCPVFAATPLTSGSSMPLPPFTFVGRLTDYAHVAYDADQIAEVRAYSEDGTTLLAKSSTFQATDVFYNFRLDIPLSTQASASRVTAGTKVKLVFVDPVGRVFPGEVPNDDAIVGNPGEYRRLTVILGTDANGDGISDEMALYYEALAWYLEYDIDGIDASKDYDGDGQDTLSEFIAGTNPFDKSDVFDVRALQVDFWPKDANGNTLKDWVKVTFLAKQGRAYSLYTTPSLVDGFAWRLGTFSYQTSASSLTDARLTTGGTETGWRWFYIRKDVLRRFWRIEVE